LTNWKLSGKKKSNDGGYLENKDPHRQARLSLALHHVKKSLALSVWVFYLGR